MYKEDQGNGMEIRGENQGVYGGTKGDHVDRRGTRAPGGTLFKGQVR